MKKIINNVEIMYSSFDFNKTNKNILQYLYDLARLNMLLSKKIITNEEYEKVKFAIHKISE